MKFILALSLLFIGISSYATNRCGISRYNSGNSYAVYHYGANALRTAFTTNSFQDAVAAMQKLNAVGACDADTVNCGVYEFHPGGTTTNFVIYNYFQGRVIDSKPAVDIALTTPDFDSAITAFGELVKAGGCKP